MGRQWFASSRRGLAGAASTLLVILTLTSAPVRAEEGEPAPPTVEPAQELDQNFLLLPAYDLEWDKTSTQTLVGDTLTAKLQGPELKKLPKDLKITVPSGTPSETDLGFDVADVVTASGDELHVSITATKAGQISVPSLALVDASGKPVARTNPISLEAQSTISKDDPKAKEAEPPRPPVSLGLPLLTLVLIGILILALIGGLVFWLVRWSRARRAAIPAVKEPPRPEDEVALAALAQLEKKGFVRAGQFKAHYFAISEIIKRYIGARYGFDAAESTTDEMLSHLRENRGLSGGVENTLREMFERLDLVKFTDHVPVTLEGSELLEEAKKLVLKTRRPPPVIENANGGKVAEHASS